MKRLLVLYGHPADPAAFDRHYSETHVPIALAMPNLRAFQVSRPAEADSPWYLVAELDFEDEEQLGVSMSSPEGQAAAADLERFADGGVTLLTLEVESYR